MNSLSKQLQLSTLLPNLCALDGCPKSGKLICTHCEAVPDPELFENNLPNVGYCSPSHLEEDATAHKEMRRSRRWLRFADRVAQLHYVVFTTERDTMWLNKLVNSQITLIGGVRLFEFQFVDVPASETTFCSDSVDEETRQQALHLNQCCHTICLATPLLAYMNIQGAFRIKEYNISITAGLRIASMTISRSTFTALRFNNGPLHSVLLLAPKFLPAAKPDDGPFAEAGIISDPSFKQMGFKESTQEAKDYLLKLDNIKKGHGAAEFGDGFKNFLSYSADPSEDIRFYGMWRHTAICVICNVLYPILEDLGGPKGFEDLRKQEWEDLKQKLSVQLREKLNELRSELDNILYPIEDPAWEQNLTELLKQREKGREYREMIACLYKYN
ncbi:hypothetical protein BU23DRAFT_575819 [Bimuria novae-zelandiae CBS 107.79]|uniref:Uncharacterized protein n=1 Tax=Bimuria novae-zelandiae CBS 107.79 TaxID=1447943 RepID=A0A6A5UGG4_9PLEO|nr:hypothetical protein BU23DRAFT_575819 [Bimuria novae-zelandiae CBS 107.79]